MGDKKEVSCETCEQLCYGRGIHGAWKLDYWSALSNLGAATLANSPTTLSCLPFTEPWGGKGFRRFSDGSWALWAPGPYLFLPQGKVNRPDLMCVITTSLTQNHSGGVQARWNSCTTGPINTILVFHLWSFRKFHCHLKSSVALTDLIWSIKEQTDSKSSETLLSGSGKSPETTKNSFF